MLFMRSAGTSPRMSLCAKIFVLAVSLVFLSPITVLGDGNYLFKHIESNQGLASSYVKCIVEDSYGFMWFGTKSGLNRYDGFNICGFNCRDYDSNHENNNIGALYEDEHKNLWVGTDRGIYIYNQVTEKFRFVSLKDRRTGVSPDNWVSIITGDHKGNVWALLPDQGVFRFHGGKMNYYQVTPQGQFKKKYPSGIIVDRGGNVWVCSTGAGLYKFNMRAGRFEEVAENGGSMLRTLNASALCEDDNGQLVLATYSGILYRYNVSNHKLSSIKFSKGGKVYFYSLGCIGNEIWLGTQNGLFIINGETGKETALYENQLNKYSLSDNVVPCIYRSKGGDVWVGTMFGGVNEYMSHNKFVFNVYGSGTALSSRRIRGMAETSGGNLWIGTENAGVNVLNLSTGVIRKANNFPGNPKTTLALYAQDGNLYAGFSRGGMYIVRPDGATTSLFANKETDNSIYSYLKDRRGDEWIGLGYALYRRKAGAKTFQHITATSFDWIFSIFEASDGAIWIGTMGNGVWKYNPVRGTFKKYVYDENKSNGLRSNCVSAIMEDRKGNIWLSTDRGGVSMYNKAKDNFITYGVAEGLPDDTSYDILEDDDGNLWFGTNRGLVRFNVSKRSVKVFTVKDGLPGDQFNYRSAVKASNGDFYFGGIEGVVSLNPGLENKSAASVPIYFTRLYLFDKAVTATSANSPLKENIVFAKSITLPYDEATFSLDFASPRYGITGNDVYSYRLLPDNEDWIPIRRKNISFLNLAPGEYTLQVKVNDGHLAIRSITIKILPPWWRSIYAYLGYILLVAAGVWYSAIWYRRRKKAQLEEERHVFTINKEKELYQNKVKFFTEIAHEICTPLTLIEAPLEVVDGLDVSDDNVRENLKVARQNTKRLLELTGQLLDFQKIDSRQLELKYENVDVTALVNDVVYRFGPAIALKNKELISNIGTSEIVAHIDKEAVTKIVSNLLNNALKYSRRVIIVSLDADDEYFRVKVVSDSDKIPVENSENIFKPFYQNDSNANGRNGVGIGLALSRSLAMMLNGSLILEENNEKDNTFVLTLPINSVDITHGNEPIPENLDGLKEEREYLSVGERYKNTVLLVEDDDEMRGFVARQLRVSFIVLEATNGQEAIDKLHGAHADIILTDIMMPVMDGFELCKRVKQDLDISHIPLVFITAKNDIDSKIRGLKCGAEGYIAKPFSIKEVAQLLRSILDNRRREQEAFSKNPFFKVDNMQMNKADEEFMGKVIKVIEDNITEIDFNVESMGELLFMSRSSLLRKIKTLFHQSPVELIRIVKLKKAAELIQDGKYRIGDICYMVGITSPSYFSKLFFKQFGITPKDFEKQSQKGARITINTKYEYNENEE